jgi:hypothetical protein
MGKMLGGMRHGIVLPRCHFQRGVPSTMANNLRCYPLGLGLELKLATTTIESTEGERHPRINPNR